MLSELEVLRHPKIQLNEVVAALCVRRQVVLIVPVTCFTIVGYAVLIDVASARRDDAIGSWRRCLENRCDLKIPRQVEDPGDNKAMTLVFSVTRIASLVTSEPSWSMSCPGLRRSKIATSGRTRNVRATPTASASVAPKRCFTTRAG